MALVEIARYCDLVEARIAKSALEAAGFHPFLFDEARASVIWTEQLAIGGLRLLCFEAEAGEAGEFLHALRHSPPESPTEPDSIVLVCAALLMCIAFGWPLAGFKRPDLFHKLSALAILALTTTVWIGLRLLARA